MKVLLLEDIRGLGKKGDICEVKDGYGKNFLVAKNKAQIATNEVINRYNAKQRQIAEQNALLEAERKQLATKIKEIELCLTKRGHNGTLFGSITKEDILNELAKTHRISIDKKEIDIKTPIKSSGNFMVEIKLGAGINANLKLNVKIDEEK